MRGCFERRENALTQFIIQSCRVPSVVAAPSRPASNPLPELCNNILNRPSDQFRSFTFSVFQIILPMGGALSTAIMIFHYKLIALNSIDMPPRISTIGSCLVNRQRDDKDHCYCGCLIEIFLSLCFYSSWATISY